MRIYTIYTTTASDTFNMLKIFKDMNSISILNKTSFTADYKFSSIDEEENWIFKTNEDVNPEILLVLCIFHREN